MAACAISHAAWGSPSSSTTIAVNSAAGPASSVVANTVITLTATVTSGEAAVTTGQVTFCDASAAYCEDVHILGTAQLTSAGTAALKFIPGIGSHSYKAVFVGTTAIAGSSSAASTLAVTGSQPTTTTIAQSGAPGNYSLTATVTGGQELAPPTGNILFLDTSNGNAQIGSAALENDAPSLGWISSSLSDVNVAFGAQIVKADFNGDGIPDFAVVDEFALDIDIFLGNGDGTFHKAPNSPVMIANLNGIANFVATADFNSDGKTDLAVGIGDISNVGSAEILLGNGDGSFTPVASGLVGFSGPSSVLAGVGDFNGDGIADLVSVDRMMPTSVMTIYFGEGDGTFSSATGSLSFPFETIVSGFGDFNGDGQLDLVLSLLGTGDSVLLGNGDGTFSPGSVLSGPAFGQGAIAIADFNGDGKEDIAVDSDQIDSVLVCLGNGDGTFTEAPQTNPTIQFPGNMAATDFNGDGKVDLIVGNGVSPELTALIGNGDGTFTNAPGIAVGDESSGALTVAVGDLNGDGLPDVLATTLSDVGVGLQVVLTQLTHLATGTVTGISPAGLGVHLIEASYPGDRGYSGSNSGTTAITGIVANVTISPGVLPGGVVGTAYGQPLTATGGLAPYSFKVSTGVLPSGLRLSAGGVLSGTPTVGGTFSFTITATDSSANPGPYMGSLAFSLTIAKPTITLSPATLPGGVVGTAYSQTVTATGGTAPYSFKVTAGALPAGLSLSAGGSLAGTSTSSGSFNFAVTATDSSGGGGPYSGSVTYSVTVAPAPDFSFTGTPTSFMVTPGQSASSTLTVTPTGGFNSTVSLSCGTLPAETTCSFASPQLMTGSGVTTTLASFTTTARSTAFNTGPTGVPPFDKRTGSTILLAAVSLFFVPRRFRGKFWLSLAIMAMVAGGLSGCGGSGSNGGGNAGTPAGTYSVVITGTGGTGTGAISHAVTISLTVQ